MQANGLQLLKNLVRHPAWQRGAPPPPEGFATEAGRQGAAAEMGYTQERFRSEFHDLINEYELAHKQDRFGRLGSYEWRMKQLVRENYRRAFQLGKERAGLSPELTAEDQRYLKKLDYDENMYLRGFLKRIEGKVSGVMPIPERADLYGNAMGEAYWAGFAVAAARQGFWLRWVMHTAIESCVDCEAVSHGGTDGQGLYPPDDFLKMGVFPKSGHLICTTRCHCSLHRVRHEPTGYERVHLPVLVRDNGPTSRWKQKQSGPIRGEA
jgi:hypothetical protein